MSSIDREMLELLGASSSEEWEALTRSVREDRLLAVLQDKAVREKVERNGSKALEGLAIDSPRFLELIEGGKLGLAHANSGTTTLFEGTIRDMLLREKLPEADVPSLMKALRSNTAAVRATVLECLAKYKDPANEQLFVDALGDADEVVRLTAASKLPTSNAEATAVLIYIAEMSQDFFTKCDAWTILLRRKSPQIMEFLIKTTHQRRSAFRGLERYDDPRAQEVWQHYSTDEEKVRRLVAEKKPEGRQRCLRDIKALDPVIRDSAAEMLRHYPDSRRALAALKKALQDDDKKVRHTAMISLRRFTDLDK